MNTHSETHKLGRADPVNKLRVLRDFDHLPRPGRHNFENIDDVYDEVIATSTALEFVMVMLFEFEDRQVRSDYLFNLLEPHVARLSRTTDGLSQVIDKLGRDGQ